MQNVFILFKESVKITVSLCKIHWNPLGVFFLILEFSLRTLDCNFGLVLVKTCPVGRRLMLKALQAGPVSVF